MRHDAAPGSRPIPAIEKLRYFEAGALAKEVCTALLHCNPGTEHEHEIEKQFTPLSPVFWWSQPLVSWSDILYSFSVNSITVQYKLV